MRLVQYRETRGHRAVAVVEDGRESAQARRLLEAETIYELALEALELGKSMLETVQSHGTDQAVDLTAVGREGRLLAPLEHPVPTRCWITGSGMTHNSAQPGPDGVQPQWFFRGNGSSLAACGHPLPLPDFALSGGEESEVVGLYVIADDGTPCRLGWALGNEFTDHRLLQQSPLYLAQAKLRTSAVGPELLLGELPGQVQGTSRIRRGDQVVWEKPFATGEANMNQTIEQLETYHFRYPMFRRPGDVHLHFLGAGVVSSAEGFQAQAGDVFEISAPAFGLPLRNPLEWAMWTGPRVRAL